MFYTNSNRSLVINSEIVEYDIKSANISIIKTYKMLEPDIISKIENMKKQDRVIAVGKIMKKDKSFSKNLESYFNSIMNTFIDDNSLDKDYDIASIKRDAAFVINRKIKKSKYGEYINFIPKNKYHAYLFLSPYEFYFGENKIDVKGIQDDILQLHDNGILSFLFDIINIAERTNMDQVAINRYLQEFCIAYKNRELGFDMYREFTNESRFRYNIMGEQMLLSDIDESLINKIDISYNYTHIILPIIQILC